MNIFQKVALQNLKKNRTRTLVTLIGVILSAALVTAVTSFGISLLSYMIQGNIQKRGDWHAAFTDASTAFVQEQTADSRIADVTAFANIGYARLEGGKNPDKPYLFLAGFDRKAFDTLPLELLAGRLPQSSNEVLVPLSVSVNGGVKYLIGDTLKLAVGFRQAEDRTLSQHDPYSGETETLVPQSDRDYTVVGIYQRAAFEEYTAPGYTLITSAEPTGSDGSTDSYTLFVTLKHPFQVRSYARERQADFLNDDVLRFMGLSDDKLFTTLLLTTGTIVVLIIMTGSVFLIYNSFQISLNERTHQLGILMSVGATEKQLLHSVLFEGLCIGTAAIPFGILIGLGSMGFVLEAVNDRFTNIMYDNVALKLVVSVPAIAAAALISLLTILISAYLPAHQAVRTPVMECIRQTNEVKTESKTVRTSSLSAKLYGLEGVLALKNFKRNRRRYRSIVLSLVLSVVLFVSVNAFVTDLNQASQMAVSFTTYDIGLDAMQMDDTELLPLFEQLKTLDTVRENSLQEVWTYACKVKVSNLSGTFLETMPTASSTEDRLLSMQLLFVDDAYYLQMLEQAGLPAEEYMGENAKLFGCAKIEYQDNRVREVNEFEDIFLDDAVDVTLIPKKEKQPILDQAQNVTFTPVELIVPDVIPNTEQTFLTEDDPHNYVLTAVAPYSKKENFHTAAASLYSRGLTFCSDQANQALKEIERVIFEQKIRSDYQIWNVSKVMKDNTNMIFIARVFAYTFVAMVSLIAIANVFNTISTNIQMRKRELAMLRSIGMSERDFQKMMNFECIFYGMRALLCGLPVSGLLSWLIYLGMTQGGADVIEFQLPWASIGMSVVSVLLIIFITMLYATSKIKQENIIDALRDEMT